MPFLAAILAPLTGMATNLFAQFVLLFGRKFTVSTAAVLAFLATTLAMLVCMKSILGAMVAAIVIPSWVYAAIAWFIPSNAVGIISAILSGKICKQAYLMANTKIDLITKAN